MSVRKAVGILIVIAAFVSSCSDSETPASADAPTTVASSITLAATPPTPTLPTFIAEFGLDLDIDIAWRALCTAWRFDDHYDEAVINEALESLFPHNSDNSNTVSAEQLDATMAVACAEATTAAGVTAGLESLRITAPDVERYIDDACDRYVQSVRGVPGGQDFDATVSGPLGLSHEEMTQIVIDICSQQRFDAWVAPIPPSILPNDSTPGEVDPEFDALAACDTALTPPPIDDELAAEVLAAYGLSAEGHDVHRLIPFALGGTTTVANLFPIAIDAHPGSRDKLGVDQLVIERVCAGESTVQEAGVALVIDWPTAVPTLASVARQSETE